MVMTELLELLAGDADLPSDQVEEDCMKGDLRSLLASAPSAGMCCGCVTAWMVKIP